MEFQLSAWAVAEGHSLSVVGAEIERVIRFDDPRPVADQVNQRYHVGGGWRQLDPVKLGELAVMAEASLNGEKLILLDGQFLKVVQPDGSFQISRVD